MAFGDGKDTVVSGRNLGMDQPSLMDLLIPIYIALRINLINFLIKYISLLTTTHFTVVPNPCVARSKCVSEPGPAGSTPCFSYRPRQWGIPDFLKVPSLETYPIHLFIVSPT